MPPDPSRARPPASPPPAAPPASARPVSAPGAPGVSALRGGGPSAPGEDLQRRISAYPPNVTFNDLIRKNRRQSVLLMAVMVFLAVVLGGFLASFIAAYTGVAPSVESLIPSIFLGAAVGALVAILAATWSWFGGASAILTMSGAQEISRNDDLELFNVVEEMSLASGLPMPRIFIIKDSAMNAFATGRDPKHGMVAVTLGLRQKLSRDELQGVIAHEMAHIKHLDIRFSMLMATLVGLIVFMSDAFLRTMWYSGHGRRGYGGGGRNRGGGQGSGPLVIILVVVGILLAILAPLFARIIQMSYSRQREYLADAGAVELTRNPLGLASALQKLSDDDEPLVDAANRGTAHMYIVNPLRKMRKSHQSINSVFSSHPPVKDRIARIMALMQ
jgi:heat shock protein HtpX